MNQENISRNFGVTAKSELFETKGVFFLSDPQSAIFLHPPTTFFVSQWKTFLRCAIEKWDLCASFDTCLSILRPQDEFLWGFKDALAAILGPFEVKNGLFYYIGLFEVKLAPKMATKASLKPHWNPSWGRRKLIHMSKDAHRSHFSIAHRKNIFWWETKKVRGGCKNMTLWGSLKKNSHLIRHSNFDIAYFESKKDDHHF